MIDIYLERRDSAHPRGTCKGKLSDFPQPCLPTSLSAPVPEELEMFGEVVDEEQHAW